MAEASKDALKRDVSEKKVKKDVNKTIAKKDVAKTGRLDELKSFLAGSRSELKKVHWPNRQQLVAYTGVVLISVFIVAIMIWLVDSGLAKLLQILINLAK